MAKPTTIQHPHSNGTKPCATSRRDWRCTECFNLLGRRSDGAVHVQFARGHQYMMCAPVTAVCRSCGTLNELRN